MTNEAKTIKCPNCGYDNPADVSVCIKCRFKIYEKEKPTESQKKKSIKGSGYISFAAALICVLSVYFNPEIMVWIGDSIYLLIVLFFAAPPLKEEYEEKYRGNFSSYFSYRLHNILNKDEIGNTLNFIVCLFLPIVPILGIMAYMNALNSLFY